VEDIIVLLKRRHYMNFAKRGITSVTRKPGKTMILLVLIFMLGNIIAGAISVRQAVDNTELNLRAKMNPVATISYDQEKLENYSQNPGFRPEMIPVETIEKIGASPYVKYFDYSVMASMESPRLKKYVKNLKVG
jgi:putative ABC transport system permease protein